MGADGTPVRRRAGIYVRISRDTMGTAAGVTRQQEECRTLAAGLGWDVVEVYVDNDVSAFGDRHRPAFEKMRADVAARHIDAIVAWHLDRLSRKPLEIEALIDQCDKLSVQMATCKGDVDLATPAGRLFARQLGAFARYEGEHKAERQRAANRALALTGAPRRGGMRCYGYATDNKTVVPKEAELLREMARRLLAGDSIRSVVVWANETNKRTVTGRPWSSWTVRRLMLNPRLAGLRVYQGEVVGPGDWEPVFDKKTYERLQRLFNDPERKALATPRAPRRYLLTGGLLVCGLCGQPLQSQPSNSGKRGYACKRPIGCGRIRIAADPLEEAAAAHALARLASPKVRGRIEQAAAGVDADSGDRLVAVIEDLEKRLRELGEDYGDGLIGRTEFHAARERINTRLADARDRLAQAARLAQLPVADPRELATWWEDAPLERRRELIATVLDHVSVAKATRLGPIGLDEERLTWVWR